MLNLSVGKDYLLYWLKAKNRHGLHSPFVYKLVDEVIYDFSDKKVYDEIENIRKRLITDQRLITVTDLGAGSQVNKNLRKSVGTIAKNALKPRKLAQLLHRLAAYFKPRNIVELGTCLGTTTLYLQSAAPKARIYTLEGCPQTADVASEVFEKAGANHIELITGNFDDTLQGVIDRVDQLDFVFVDGNHQKQATLNYFEWCLPKVHEDTVLIFDDIYWSAGMKEAWAAIKAHPQVTITVDLFFIGLVFFKKGKVKEDFFIKL